MEHHVTTLDMAWLGRWMPPVNILTTTLSLIPILAVPSTKGQWDRTMGECPFRQQYAGSAQHRDCSRTSHYVLIQEPHLVLQTFGLSMFMLSGY